MSYPIVGSVRAGSQRPKSRLPRAYAWLHTAAATILDADALPAMIAQIRAARYGFVTLDTLLS